MSYSAAQYSSPSFSSMPLSSVEEEARKKYLRGGDEVDVSRGETEVEEVVSV